MIGDAESNKLLIWDGKNQVYFCEFGEGLEGGWHISTVKEIMVLSEPPKTDKALYTLHDLLSDVRDKDFNRQEVTC